MTMNSPRPDGYQATAAAYDLFVEPYRDEQQATLRAVLPRLTPDEGPILDVGCGSGAHTAFVLAELAHASVLALEPSASMRALALSRLAADPSWRSRVTVRPEGVLEAPLPGRLGGVIMLGVIGHFSPPARRQVFQRLARRLPVGGVILLDLQLPETPARVPAFEFVSAPLGALRYRGVGEAWPLEGERMRWRMTYQTLEDDAILHEDNTEHVYHHPTRDQIASELRECGLALDRLGEGTYWVATRTSS